MKSLETICISIFMVLILGFFSNATWAITSAQAIYLESYLSGGLWKYDYILYNTSDPIADAGYDIYWFTLNFDPTVTLTNIFSPSTNWDFISDNSSFIDWNSLSPGEPPLGADIAPGTSIDGFSFISDVRLSSLSFNMYLTDPNLPYDPYHYSGNTASVPEPSTILLVGSGLAGIGYFRRRRKLRKKIGGNFSS